MSHDSFGHDYNLEYKTSIMIIRYIQSAEKLIEKLKKYNLQIICIEKETQNE